MGHHTRHHTRQVFSLAFGSVADDLNAGNIKGSRTRNHAPSLLQVNLTVVCMVHASSSSSVNLTVVCMVARATVLDNHGAWLRVRQPLMIDLGCCRSMRQA